MIYLLSHFQNRDISLQEDLYTSVNLNQLIKFFTNNKDSL